MPLSESPTRRQDANVEYSYRRPLNLRELLPAIGVGIGAGLFAYYVTRLLLQRTPLRIERSALSGRRRPRARNSEQAADA
jgi:H+/Cl- antiporter ClcA